MLKRPDTVVVICLADDTVVVLHDEQPHRGAKLSLPGGRVDESDESILSAAKREVTEETGYAFKNWRLVSVMQPQAKIEWFIHVFVAWNISNRSKVHHDPGEKIEVRLKTFDEFKALVTQGSGFLGESRHLLEDVYSLQDLQQLPLYTRITVDR
jgi:8-oxo-dGTP pyrophosphatase MutT (NUDIX family)